MTGKASTAGIDRIVERRRAVALARHYREFEGLSIRQIADRLGRSPATIKAYFYDPTGEKARAVKTRYQGVCRKTVFGNADEAARLYAEGDVQGACNTVNVMHYKTDAVEQLRMALVESFERQGITPGFNFDEDR